MKNKSKFYDYEIKLKWAKKWKSRKNKKNIVKSFCLEYPQRYNYNTWYGRTIARNLFINWEKQYNLGTLKKQKENRIKKKKTYISDLEKSDQNIYQEIVEEIFENHNIKQDEITERIRKKKEQVKKKTKFCSFLKSI